MKRAIILMLDSLGVGATKDAHKFGDEGSNTFGHIARWCAEGLADVGRSGPLKVPNLAQLGLLHLSQESCGERPAGCSLEIDVIGAYGYAEELSTGKDTSSGHWEIAGVPVLFDWGYFTENENSFPCEILNEFIERAGIPGVLGNCNGSGTELIAMFGEDHMISGKPIVYTSADSVFQIACHEESFGLDRLLKISKIAREIVDKHNICRVIARPFLGSNSGNFQRTGNRRDFSVEPPSETLLEKMAKSGGEVISVGKIADIYAQKGITKKYKASGLDKLFDSTLEALEGASDHSIVFTNFVDFDSQYGHRRDVAGYAAALEYFDSRLPELISRMHSGDVLVLTADHGCDPTWPGFDHTREHIPVLVYGESVSPGSLGLRKTFADIGQSLAFHLDLPELEYGKNFLS